ncbi:uroporphyrinogen-III synthase [Hoeflea sp.]|uniref:uroporphyrinogen-III synthase n=1 Tax=Hoeflea sp. TaxID=1940281 RepID=UPI0025BC86E6|nr:uroporphyrinogen-III synthase [Hoeflea sp.]
MPPCSVRKPAQKFVGEPAAASSTAGSEAGRVRVLITRPQPGADRTAARVSQLGRQAAVMPLFEASVTASMDDLPPATEIGGLIATSARAFDMFGNQSVSESGYADIPVYAVGTATAQAARDAGFAHIHEGGGTAEALLQELVGNLAPVSSGADRTCSPDSAMPLVYLAGVPRTPMIEAGLSAHQVSLRVVECYKMNKLSYSTDIVKTDILSPAPDVVLFYSANAARAFCELAGTGAIDEVIESVGFLCLSPPIAAELPPGWQPRVTVAKRPDEDSLLALLSALE